MQLRNLCLLFIMYFVFIQFICGQNKNSFLYTKGDNNISIITMGSTRSAHCTVIEYPEFLVVHEIPIIPIEENVPDSIRTYEEIDNPLIAFIDSIYLHKPIKYILNSHHHSHSLSTVLPFLEKGTKLITTIESIKVYNRKELFGDKTSAGFSESIILISSDTVLFANTKNPIKVVYLKKSDYKSIPTETYLFFNFTNQKLLATSCMVYLKDIDTKYGYKGMIYNNRLVNVNDIISDKKLDVEKTLQLYKFRFEDGIRKLPVFPISYHENVLKHSWHRLKLSEHFQNMSYIELTLKRDSLLNFLIETDIYHIVLNHAIYELIEKKEYQKAVEIAKILVQYEPGRLNEIDTLGEAYYNNGQLVMAKHYNTILKQSKQKMEGLGIVEWEKNKKNRLKNRS